MDDREAAVILVRRSPRMPCAYCGEPMVHGDPKRQPTRDHIWPKAVRSIAEGRVGKVWCCHQCNMQKGDMMPSEWLAVLESR